MGTISQKIEYLNETKTRQKNLINALGGEITNETPFREYENELIGVLPKVTGEGTNISLSPTIEYDLEVKSLLGDTSQESYEGYNLFNLTDYTRLATTPNVNEATITKTKDTIKIITTNTSGWAGFYSTQSNPNGWAAYTDNFNTSNTYYISYDVVATTNCQIRSGFEAGLQTLSFVANQKRRITTSTNSGDSFVCYSDSPTTITMTNIVISTNSNKTSYEPYCGGIPSPNPNYPQDIQVVTGTQTLTISNADNTESQSYTLHLGDEELAKIGSYQDKIYYDNGKWYLRKEINKTTTNITSMYVISSTTHIGIFTPTNFLQSSEALCTKSKWYVRTPDFVLNQFYSNPANVAFIGNGSDTLETLQSKFNGSDFYYILNTPSTTEITNTSLLQDLNYIKEHIKSFSDTTNISSSGDLPIVISASAIRKLN